MEIQSLHRQLEKTEENNMNYTLYYTFDNIYYNEITVTQMDYEYTIQSNIQDIIEYEYENKFRKKYDALSWYLESGAKEFVKDLENKWFSNKIDTIAMFQDFKFIDWLKERYYERALGKASLESLEDSTRALMSFYRAMCEDY